MYDLGMWDAQSQEISSTELMDFYGDLIKDFPVVTIEVTAAPASPSRSLGVTSPPTRPSERHHTLSLGRPCPRSPFMTMSIST